MGRCWGRSGSRAHSAEHVCANSAYASGTVMPSCCIGLSCVLVRWRAAECSFAQTSRVLRFVDPYGDTILNSAQAGALVAELNDAEASDREQHERLIQMRRRARAQALTEAGATGIS
jgi:hypothetical protein